tara:strand:- start:13 stop:411 length:399 start_codon:yes stop_codon:yes gene_type:complete
MLSIQTNILGRTLNQSAKRVGSRLFTTKQTLPPSNRELERSSLPKVEDIKQRCSELGRRYESCMKIVTEAKTDAYGVELNKEQESLQIRAMIQCWTSVNDESIGFKLGEISSQLVSFDKLVEISKNEQRKDP